MELDKIYHGDSRRMDKIDDESVHLTVTSPPYYVGKKYEKYLPTLDSYLKMLCDVFQEVVRVTVPGGKIVINIGDIAVGSRYNEGFPEEILVMPKLLDSLRNFGAYLYSRIIWEKDDPWANSSHVTFHKKIAHTEYRILPAWEYVFVFRKGREGRKDKIDSPWIDKHTEWKPWVHGVWKIRSVQSNKFHEAMFPEELVKRCIKMYSYPEDIVLDPFMGSGKTAIVAKKLNRHYVGYELEKRYVKLSEGNIDQITSDMIEDQKRYDFNNDLQEDLF